MGWMDVTQDYCNYVDAVDFVSVYCKDADAEVYTAFCK